MAHHEDHHQRSRKLTVLSLSALTALAAILGIFFLTTPAQANGVCSGGDSRDEEVECEDEEEQEGEDNGDSDGDNGDTYEPSEGDTWDEVKYTECLQWEEGHQEGYCRATNADECPDGTNFYMTYIRVWTYEGGQWTYDESVGDDGWERDHSAEDCLDPEEIEEETGEVTEDMVIEAFNSQPLPSGEIGANPPEGRTLAGNFDTIFYTEQGEEQFTLPLHELNRAVEIIATPTSYNWDFGDGNTESWDTEGQAYESGIPMSEYHTHRYSDTGEFQVELTIDYEVRFNYGDGWEPISEPITSQASNYDIEVLENTTLLRDGN